MAVNLPESFDDTIGYHSSCYSNFTAIHSSTQPTTDEESKQYTLRSDTPETVSPSHTSGIFPPSCIFCGSVSKSKGRSGKEFPGNCETKNAAEAIYDAAVKADDKQMLARISGIDIIAKEVKYHHSCKRSYLHRASVLGGQSPMMDHGPSPHDRAFLVLKYHIQETLVESEGAEHLTSLHERYLKDQQRFS
jgi:hypothetical protein